MACNGISPKGCDRAAVRAVQCMLWNGREASGLLHFTNIDALAAVQGPKLQQANGGNNGRTRNAVQSTKQATAWINCAEGKF